jgi:hypothetical protein
MMGAVWEELLGEIGWEEIGERKEKELIGEVDH